MLTMQCQQLWQISIIIFELTALAASYHNPSEDIYDVNDTFCVCRKSMEEELLCQLNSVRPSISMQ